MSHKSAVRVAFIGGIHGVGKTQLCDRLSRLLSLKHFSAGALIKGDDRTPSTQDKRVLNVDTNQAALLAALEKITDREYLLDGHFCLLDAHSNIQPAPMRVFGSLKITVVAVVRDSIDNIKARLTSRDSRAYSSDLLERFQRAEIAHATDVSGKLGLPLRLTSPDEIDETAAFIKRHIARGE